jgi:TRAP transporter TAXI family solute receptor
VSLWCSCFLHAAVPLLQIPLENKATPRPPPPPSADGPSETRYITIGTCPSTSGAYPFWASLADAITTTFPNYIVSASEGTGAVGNANRVRAGEVDFASTAAATDYENYTGTLTFEGDPYPEHRMLGQYMTTNLIICVSKDSGVNTLEDLDGKRFNPGGNGTTAESMVKDLCEMFDVHPNYFISSMGDAVDAYSNRECIGVSKTGNKYDSMVIQLNAALPVKWLSLTEEQITKLCEAYPYAMPATIPAGTYDFIDEDVQTISMLSGFQTSSNLSQEDGYYITKALFEEPGRSVWLAAAPTYGDEDWYELTLQSPTPLHAGTVQYFIECGYEVPEELIPPEYVPVS